MTLWNICGCDYSFQGVKIHNPTITELSKVIPEEENLFFALKILSSSLLDGLIVENIPQDFSDFNVFFSLLFDQSQSCKIFGKEKIQAIVDLLLLLFTDYNVSMGAEEIIFEKANSILILNNDNFEEFQKIIQKMFKTSFLFNGEGGDTKEYNPANKKAQEILNKLNKSKEKIAKMNGDHSYTTALIENYTMIVSVGLQQSPKIISDTLTLYHLLTLFIRFKMKLEWDLDVDCRLAGGSPEEHPDNWMKII